MRIQRFLHSLSVLISLLYLGQIQPIFAAETPTVSSGKLDVIKQFKSDYIEERTFYVWLPDSFDADNDTSVLYMHDGQMLFDDSITWNRQEWGVDEVAGKLIAEGKLKHFIVVGIENAGPSLRGPEYFPQNAVRYIKDKEILAKDTYIGTELRANDYLKFLIHELKPYLAKQYGVQTTKDYSFLAGSSMGGLISMYAISEHPDEFAAAACLSTHWPGTVPAENSESITQAFLDYMADNLPNPDNHRLYFDYGTETLDSLYPPLQKRADEIIRAMGYTSENWVTKEFQGAAHDEISWRARLDAPLLFLLAK